MEGRIEQINPPGEENKIDEFRGVGHNIDDNEMNGALQDGR